MTDPLLLEAYKQVRQPVMESSSAGDKITEIVFSIFDQNLEDDRREWSAEDFTSGYQVTPELGVLLHEIFAEGDNILFWRTMWRAKKLMTQKGVPTEKQQLYLDGLEDAFEPTVYEDLTDLELWKDIQTALSHL